MGALSFSAHQREGSRARTVAARRRLRALDRDRARHDDARSHCDEAADAMSGPQRIDAGGGHGSDIDRSRRLDFSFDGQAMSGFAGDTIASALLANGVRIVGRSFKYHRPRGIFAAGGEEPNAIVDLRHAQRHDPNARATLEPLQQGMTIRSTHARGTAQSDRLSFLDRFARFIPAGFYYKTFMWPRFRLYEDAIRALAGIGRVDAASHAPRSRHRFLNVDLCVIGGGQAGITAALEA